MEHVERDKPEEERDYPRIEWMVMVCVMVMKGVWLGFTHHLPASSS